MSLLHGVRDKTFFTGPEREFLAKVLPAHLGKKGRVCWTDIAKYPIFAMRKRTPEQLQNVGYRMAKKLRNGIEIETVSNHCTTWTPEEDETILKAYGTYGNDYKRIAKEWAKDLNGRTVNSIRGRHYALRKRNIDTELSSANKPSTKRKRATLVIVETQPAHDFGDASVCEKVVGTQDGVLSVRRSGRAKKRVKYSTDDDDDDVGDSTSAKKPAAKTSRPVVAAMKKHPSSDSETESEESLVAVQSGARPESDAEQLKYNKTDDEDGESDSADSDMDDDEAYEE